jgi:hypothetical protein
MKPLTPLARPTLWECVRRNPSEIRAPVEEVGSLRCDDRFWETKTSLIFRALRTVQALKYRAVKMVHVVVIVLGDTGRSPRMQVNHMHF